MHGAIGGGEGVGGGGGGGAIGGVMEVRLATQYRSMSLIFLATPFH